MSRGCHRWVRPLTKDHIWDSLERSDSVPHKPHHLMLVTYVDDFIFKRGSGGRRHK